MPTFATSLAEHRARLKLTQNEAATLLDVPPRTYWEWEHAKTVPLKIAQEGALLRFRSAKPKR